MSLAITLLGLQDFLTSLSSLLQEWTDYFLEYGAWGLGAISFMESSFFPIPPDVLLIPMGIAQPDLALWFAFITTITSVAGALLGWWLGNKFGRKLMLRFFKPELIEKVENYFERYGGAALAIAGFTPIPYKVFTIASGMCNVKKRDVILWSLLGRGGRFFLEAAIIIWLGKAAQEFINEYFGIITLSVGGLLVIGYIIYALIKKNRKKATN